MPNEDLPATLERAAYLEERKRYLDGDAEAAKQYDRHVVTGAGGALALSVTFLEKIAPNPALSTRPLLIGAWVLMLFSLLLTFFSQFSGQYAWRHALRKLDADYAGKRLSQGRPLENSWDTLTAWVNALAGVTLIGGIGLLVLFAILNASFTS